MSLSQPIDYKVTLSKLYMFLFEVEYVYGCLAWGLLGRSIVSPTVLIMILYSALVRDFVAVGNLNCHSTVAPFQKGSFRANNNAN